MTSQATALTPTRADSFPATALRALTRTERTWAPFVQRLALAVVMFPHGAQKLLGWWGGYGFEGTLGYLTGTVGLPAALAVGVILLEFVGPLLLAFGLLVRPVALGLVGIMIGAITSVHAAHGFFMNWSGAQAGEGFEYHLLVIALGLGLALTGGGRLALDRALSAADGGAARTRR